jgi:antitoxin CptB
MRVAPDTTKPARRNDALPMTDPASLDARRRRARFRAWHRGMKEMDLLLGGYADAHVAAMNENELDAFERLMEVLDRDLLQWFTGEAPVPPEHDSPLFRAICAHHEINLT